VFKIPQQFLPLVVVFLLVIAALIVARELFVPETFGDLGHYRASSVDEIASLPLAFAGAEACYDCHDDIYETKQQSNHNGVSCEVCHGPAVQHVEAPDEFTPGAPRGRGYCPLCHGYNPSRPSGFPQIIAELHNPGKACMTCHEPHNPLLPHTPEECSACHREIARKKMVSHHTGLACTRCHTVLDGHLDNPRANRALKPVSGQTCGQCHDQAADSDREIPRIDLETHGQRYLCWDCHYPHYPEANL
jgi:hypothetical protein